MERSKIIITQMRGGDNNGETEKTFSNTKIFYHMKKMMK